MSAPPGTSTYLPELLARARNTHPDIPVDPVILQCLLLCLIAQARLPLGSRSGSHIGLHLILRTREEDVGLVVNLAALILQHILGVSTHKHKIAPKVAASRTRSQSRRNRNPSSVTPAQTERPDALLRSLFFRRARRASMSSHRSSTPRPRSGVSVDTTPRSGSVPLAAQWKSPWAHSHTPQHSASYPTLSTDGEDDVRHFDAASLASSRRPLLAAHSPASTMRSRGSRGRPGAHRLRTDPFPLSSLFTPPGATHVSEAAEDLAVPITTPESVRPQKGVSAGERTDGSDGTISTLPKAVVVSGLEHTSAPSQRALMRVLSERRVIFDRHENEETDLSGQEPDAEDGTWNLPDGFVLVYVCKSDPHERPPILRALVDRFSMSADILLPTSVRQGYLAYRAAHSPTPRGTPIPSPLALPHSVHAYFPGPPPAHHSPVRRTTPLPAPAPAPQTPPSLPTSELAHLRTLARAHPAAAPIFYPSVHATTALHAPTPASRGASAGAPPPPPPHAALHPTLELYLLDLFAAARHHPALDGTLLTLRAHADAEALARAFRVLGGDTVGGALVAHEASAETRGPGTTVGPGSSVEGASWADAAWRSEESVVGKTRGRGVEEEKEKEKERGRYRFRVDGEDGSRRSFSAGFDGVAFLGSEAGAARRAEELSPAEALDAAVARAWSQVWDVSEEDVARVFPRVVSHRLRARDGPDDEILSSVMWPAVPPEAGAVGEREAVHEDGATMGWERKSVKDILVRILADV